ncbi:MAG: Zn-dependent oligopeptidase [Chlamydiales bacterium]|nr:Zn-dependent oligopeptidase [Chlamydiales bacterium]
MINLAIATALITSVSLCQLDTAKDVEAFFPLTKEAMLDRKEAVLNEFNFAVDHFINSDEPSLEAFDQAFGTFSYGSAMFNLLSMVHTDPLLRKMASKIHGELRKVDHATLLQHPEIYAKLAQISAADEKEEYFLQNCLDDLKKQGLSLDEVNRIKLQNLKEDLTDLCSQFDQNIRESRKTFSVNRSELTGMSDQFIDSLEQDENGDCVLTTDYPVYFPITKQCSNGAVRKKMSQIFGNRAYPENDQVLQDIVQKRQELAQLLGYDSYAHLQLSGEMVKSPDRASQFLNAIAIRLGEKSDREFDLLSQDLPPGVALDDQGKLKPWDESYAAYSYLKKHYDIDPEEIKAYFPLNTTLRGLMDIYETFLGIKLEEIEKPQLWHESVRLVRVSNPTTLKTHGFIVLDLHPRAGKFTHACDCPLHPALQTQHQNFSALSVLICNFADGDQGLMYCNDVRTFFHEFGHALHDMLGRTRFVSTCGTSTKSDFVELPSQLLEEWLWDEQILQMCSSHYETHDPLPKAIIERMIAAKNVFTGMELMKQVMYANFSLQLHSQNPQNLQMLWNGIESRFCTHRAVDQTHRYAAFGHLNGYGARYYGYLWSKVFALDVFAKIRSEGLLNPDAGAKYVNAIIGQGGSIDPNDMLNAFLGRDPTQDAFFENIGLD